MKAVGIALTAFAVGLAVMFSVLSPECREQVAHAMVTGMAP